MGVEIIKKKNATDKPDGDTNNDIPLSTFFVFTFPDTTRQRSQTLINIVKRRQLITALKAQELSL